MLENIAVYGPDVATAVAQFKIGTEARVGNKIYQYFQRGALDTGTNVAGSIFFAITSPDDDNTVVFAQAGGIPDNPRCIAECVVTAGYYFWGVVEGPVTIATNGDDDIVGGVDLIVDATKTYGVCDSAAHTGFHTYALGRALADDDNTANTVLGFIRLPR